MRNPFEVFVSLKKFSKKSKGGTTDKKTCNTLMGSKFRELFRPIPPLDTSYRNSLCVFPRKMHGQSFPLRAGVASICSPSSGPLPTFPASPRSKEKIRSNAPQTDVTSLRCVIHGIHSCTLRYICTNHYLVMC